MKKALDAGDGDAGEMNETGTLFVKNLHFDTTEGVLKRVGRSCLWVCTGNEKTSDACLSLSSSGVRSCRPSA